MKNAYLGPKGYTLFKCDLTKDEEQQIKKDLTAKPFVIPNSIQKAESFMIYRESSKKLYIPRFYGIEKYGKPNTQHIEDGEDIHIEFRGNLREYQIEVVNAYIKKALDVGGGLLDIPCGYGKTVMALNIISKLQKKTLIIVHKEFLMNQWIERIQEYLPNAKVGKIQGKVIDTDNKDIVIGMLQSLSMKDLPETLFQQFGLTVVDETHHIAAEVFSRSLFKIVTKYMLGLSATMERKDGLTHIFKKFIGDIAYKIKKGNSDDNVLVHTIQYKYDDSEYNKVIYNFKGQVHYSVMISRLCEFVHRSECILRVLCEELKKRPEQQVMILAHNKSLLKYLYDAIEERNIATVGYYVGGMKESALKESETKKVVIATYAMAEEALDIKSLSALILATPKTDVTQATGRILRIKHKCPVVYDIVDIHDIFQKQYIKRRKFYIQCNYKIVETSSQLFLKCGQPLELDCVDTSSATQSIWKTIYDPETATKCVKNKKTQLEKIKKSDNEKNILQGKCLIQIDT
jgi:superfamily II DNA or RNA helicase